MPYRSFTKRQCSKLTRCLFLSAIEAAKNAIGQRVVESKLDESERKEIVHTLNGLSALKREARGKADQPEFLVQVE